MTAQMPKSGCLLLCSDGMWNFLQEPEQIASRVSELNAGTDALSITRDLVQFANDRGGRDNITAVALCLS
jgi:serine/threonine protein phosphatase PrpC